MLSNGHHHLADLTGISFTYQGICVPFLGCTTIQATLSGKIAISNITVNNITLPNASVATSITCGAAQVSF